MIDEKQEEQAALWAMDLLPPDEAREFEAQLAADPELRAFADEMRAAAAQMAHAVTPQPLPAGMEDRIRAAIAEPAAANVVPFRRSVPWIPWAMAASFAVACVWLLQDRGSLQQRVVQLERHSTLSEMKIAILTSQLDNAPNASGAVVWNSETQSGVLEVSSVPGIPAEQDYQLWVVDPKYPQPVSGGVFHVTEDGHARMVFRPEAPVSEVKAFAISRERAGGVPKAEGPIVLSGK